MAPINIITYEPDVEKKKPPFCKFAKCKNVEELKNREKWNNYYDA